MAKHEASEKPEIQHEEWQVHFMMTLSPAALKPNWINCVVSRGVPNGEGRDWFHNGTATFEGPEFTIPAVGAPLIPYFMYHLELIQDYLTACQLELSLTDGRLQVDEKVGVSEPPPGTEGVYYRP